MKIKVEVTQEDIECDGRGCAYTCMVSRAIARALKVPEVYTNYRTTCAYFGIPPYISTRYVLPLEVYEKILLWDDGDKTIQPFSFEVEVEPQ